MLKPIIRIAIRPNNLLFQIIAGCGLGLILGLACLRFSPLLVLGMLAAFLLAYVTLKRPEIALLGILVATSSIVFEEQLPMLSVGISLHIPDLLLLGSLGLIALRWLVESEFKIVRTPLDWPLLIFYGMTLFSTFVALIHSSVDAVEARRWIRILSYYLTFFIVTNLVRERRQLTFMLNGLFLLATIVAAAMVAQLLLGDSIRILPGRIETLNTQGTVFEDITRILPPGWSIVLVSFVAILCILVLEKFRPLGWLKFLQCGLLGMALLVTFLRSYWAVLILVFVLLGYLFRGVERQRLMGWGLLVVSLAAMLLLVVFSNPSSRAARLVGASTNRLSSLGGAIQGQDTSLNWRMLENGYAISTIAANPWIGLGMGFTYRPYDRRLDISGDPYDFRKHIHNGHLWILLQSGLLGYLSFTWLSLAFLMRGFRYWRSVTNPQFKGVVLGFTLVYLAVLIAAWVNSTFMQWRWTPVIGIIMGINEIILLKFGQEESIV
jgi:O-antigen ligase